MNQAGRYLLVPATVLALVLAGCGGGGGGGGGGAAADTPPAHKGKTLYTSNGWTVTVDGDKPTLWHYTGDKWVVDNSSVVKIEILGPKPNKRAPNPPQVAITMRSKQPLVESALWVDDLHLFEKGGGSPTNGTIYGAPANPLAAGRHLAVGYARTAFGGTVVAWPFTVR
ncbi:MAG TPA: hypothetical protein VGH35_13755 [Gaiellaceae bacterium]